MIHKLNIMMNNSSIIAYYSMIPLFICLMARDKTYIIVKNLIEQGFVKNISDLLNHLDKTPFSKDIKTSPYRLNKLIENPALFQFQDAYNISEVLKVDPKIIIDLVHNEWVIKKQKKKR
jgi:hypothetical protein